MLADPLDEANLFGRLAEEYLDFLRHDIGYTRRATGPLVTLLELVLGVGVSHALSFFFPYFMETKRNPCALRFPHFALSDTTKSNLLFS
jgi:hypothetical protein